jgi:hypothetical protein
VGRAAYKGFRRRRGAARLVLSSSFSPSLSLRVVSVCVWVAAVGFGWGLGGACSCAVGLGRFGVGPVRALRVVIVMGLFFFPSFPFLSFTPLPRATRAAAGRLCDVGGESPSAARRSRVHCMWGQQERFPVSFLFLRREGAQPRPSSFCQHGTREHNNTCSRMGHGPRAATTPQKFRRVSSSGSFDLSSANDRVSKKIKR